MWEVIDNYILKGGTGEPGKAAVSPSTLGDTTVSGYPMHTPEMRLFVTRVGVTTLADISDKPILHSFRPNYTMYGRSSYTFYVHADSSSFDVTGLADDDPHYMILHINEPDYGLMNVAKWCTKKLLEFPTVTMGIQAKRSGTLYYKFDMTGAREAAKRACPEIF